MRETEKYATLQNQFRMHAAKCHTKFVAFDNKNWAKITLVTIILLQKLTFRLPCCRWAWQLIAYVTRKVHHGCGLIKNLSMKSDFSQTRPSRWGLDSECEAFWIHLADQMCDYERTQCCQFGKTPSNTFQDIVLTVLWMQAWTDA